MKNIKNKKSAQIDFIQNGENKYIAKTFKIYNFSMLMEINILATCNHPNIIEFHKIELIDNKISLIFPFCPKSFIDVIQSSESILSKMNYMLQIAHGIHYLHYHNIAHLDIKPDNIMINNNTIKIIDFGNAQYFYNKNQINISTVTHRAPESKIGKQNDLEKLDVWSFGIILIELFSGCEMYKNISCRKIQMYENEFEKFINSDKFINLIKILPDNFQSILDFNPNKRPTMKEIIFLVQNYLQQSLSISILPLKADLNYHFESLKINFQYPEYINYAIIDLLYRLQEYSYENIEFIAQELNNPYCTKLNRKIINKIVLKTKGILFQFHLFISSGPIEYEKSSLLSRLYGGISNNRILELI
jgi:serine/threonine protein kinase